MLFPNQVSTIINGVYNNHGTNIRKRGTVMKENTAKIIISAIAAGLSAYFRVMAIPIVILVLVMIIDYITGMWKAWNRGELSSRVGLKGLFKKVGYIFVVAVSGVLDWLFISGLSQIGIEVNVSFYFGLIVTIWFIINECISILENLAVIGIPLPSFLVKIVHKLKITVESKVDTNESEE